MAVDAPIPLQKDNTAIDMNIQMAVDDLSVILHKPVLNSDVVGQTFYSRPDNGRMISGQ